MPVTPEQAQQLREAQIGIRTLVERDLQAYLSTLDLSNPQIVRSRLLAFVPTLVQTYGEMAAGIAADWYQAVREAHGLPGFFRPVVPGQSFWDEQAAAVEGTIRRVTETEVDPVTALTSKVGKYVLSGSRETVRLSTFADPRASGWQRVTRAGSCRFCRMLAGRGAVYKETTAHFASHGKCNCAAVPSWDANAPEVDVRLYEASKRTTGMRPEDRDAHNAAIREALDIYVPE